MERQKRVLSGLMAPFTSFPPRCHISSCDGKAKKGVIGTDGSIHKLPTKMPYILMRWKGKKGCYRD